MGKVGETDLTWYLDLAFGFEVIVFCIWYLVFDNLGGSRGNGVGITEQQLGPNRTGGIMVMVIATLTHTEMLLTLDVGQHRHLG